MYADVEENLNDPVSVTNPVYIASEMDCSTRSTSLFSLIKLKNYSQVDEAEASINSYVLKCSGCV